MDNSKSLPSSTLINELTFSFSEPIDRVWSLLRDLKLVTSLSASNTYPVIPTSSNDITWTVDSIFEGNIMGVSTFVAKCVKMKTSLIKKTIKWHFTYSDKKENYLKISLYLNTSNNGTILYWREDFPPSYFQGERIPDIKLNNENSMLMISKIQKILKESSVDLFQFEGCVIRGDMNDVWSFVIEPQQLKKIAPLYCYDAEVIGDKVGCVGSVVKMYIDTKEKFYYTKIEKIDMKKYRNKWLIKLSCFGGTMKSPIHEVTVNIIRINQEEIYISLFHEFKEPVTQQKIKQLSQRKRYVLENLKDFIENYK